MVRVGSSYPMPRVRPRRLAVASICGLGLAGLLLGGCSMFGRGDSKPETTAATAASATDAKPAAASADQIDVRSYLGPDYCPEIRVLDGAELMRRYERGHDDDPKSLIWQASI